jgi:hypothetical protein
MKTTILSLVASIFMTTSLIAVPRYTPLFSLADDDRGWKPILFESPGEEPLSILIPFDQTAENYSDCFAASFTPAVCALGFFAEAMRRNRVESFPENDLTWNILERNESDLICEAISYSKSKKTPVRHDLFRLILTDEGIHTVRFSRKHAEMSPKEKETPLKTLKNQEFSTPVAAPPPARSPTIVFDFGRVMVQKVDKKTVEHFIRESLNFSKKQFEEANRERYLSVEEGASYEESWLSYAKAKGIDLPLDWSQSLHLAVRRSIMTNPEMADLIAELQEQQIPITGQIHCDEIFSRLDDNAAFYRPFDPNALTQFKRPLKKIIYVDSRVENTRSAKKLGASIILFKSVKQLRNELKKRKLLQHSSSTKKKENPLVAEGPQTSEDYDPPETGNVTFFPNEESRNWKISFQRSDKERASITTIPSDQPTENPSEMLSICFESKINPLELTAELVRKAKIEMFPENDLKWNILKKNESDLICEAISYSKSKTIPIQHDLIRLILTDKGVHTIWFSRLHTEMTSKEREKWVKILKDNVSIENSKHLRKINKMDTVFKKLELSRK